jgi:hypothetical protein
MQQRRQLGGGSSAYRLSSPEKKDVVRRLEAAKRRAAAAVAESTGSETRRRERTHARARDEYRRANPIISQALERQTQRREAAEVADKLRAGQALTYEQYLALPAPAQQPPATPPLQHLDASGFGMTLTWQQLEDDSETGGELAANDRLLRVARSKAVVRRTESATIEDDNEFAGYRPRRTGTTARADASGGGYTPTRQQPGGRRARRSRRQLDELQQRSASCDPYPHPAAAAGRRRRTSRRRSPRSSSINRGESE